MGHPGATGTDPILARLVRLSNYAKDEYRGAGPGRTFRE
jgi:hypothetical protein